MTDDGCVQVGTTKWWWRKRREISLMDCLILGLRLKTKERETTFGVWDLCWLGEGKSSERNSIHIKIKIVSHISSGANSVQATHTQWINKTAIEAANICRSQVYMRGGLSYVSMGVHVHMSLLLSVNKWVNIMDWAGRRVLFKSYRHARRAHA